MSKEDKLNILPRLIMPITVLLFNLFTAKAEFVSSDGPIPAHYGFPLFWHHPNDVVSLAWDLSLPALVVDFLIYLLVVWFVFKIIPVRYTEYLRSPYISMGLWVLALVAAFFISIHFTFNPDFSLSFFLPDAKISRYGFFAGFEFKG
ncbi:MAG: hypothetical protein JW841_16005 [Deltaproteobacteria bacterium]|nr:hypothetical protein [Deltaproteobacteria bacterium]